MPALVWRWFTECGNDPLHRENYQRLKGSLMWQRDITSSNGSQLKPDPFKLEQRGELCTRRGLNHWNKLPGEAVVSPALEARLLGFCAVPRIAAVNHSPPTCSHSATCQKPTSPAGTFSAHANEHNQDRKPGSAHQTVPTWHFEGCSAPSMVRGSMGMTLKSLSQGWMPLWQTCVSQPLLLGLGRK